MHIITSSLKYSQRKVAVEEVPCLTAKDFAHGKCILPNGLVITISSPSPFSGVPFVIIHYNCALLPQSVYLEYSSQPFGGKRLWVKCPDCGRRCSKIYIHQTLLVCRICLGLSYKSRQLSSSDHHRHQVNKIECRLTKTRTCMMKSWVDEPIERPKGMHRKTYANLITNLNRHKAEALTPVYRIMNKLKF